MVVIYMILCKILQQRLDKETAVTIDDLQDEKELEFDNGRVTIASTSPDHFCTETVNIQKTDLCVYLCASDLRSQQETLALITLQCIMNMW